MVASKRILLFSGRAEDARGEPSVAERVNAALARLVPEEAAEIVMMPTLREHTHEVTVTVMVIVTRKPRPRDAMDQ